MNHSEKLTVKRIPFYLFLILIGILITIVFFLWQRNYYFPKKLVASNGIIRPDWIEIPDDGDGGATDLMDRYKKEQEGIWLPSYRLRTSADEVLRGFWIDVNMLDSINNIIIRDNPHAKINGYNVFFGQYKDASKRHYALIVRATGEEGVAPKIDTVGIGKYFDMVDPCPDHCGVRK